MTQSSTPTTASVDLGPVSAAAVALVREEARRKGTVIWLDRDGLYTSLVDRLLASGDSFAFPLLAYRGSYLELMLALEGLAGDSSPEPLVIHLPGFVEDDVKLSPLLELYAPGHRFRISLPTLLEKAAHGKVPPAAVAAAAQKGLASLDDADAWLDAEVGRGDAGDEELDLPLTVPQLYDGLRPGASLAGRMKDPRWSGALDRYLERMLGIDRGWWSAEPTAAVEEQSAEDLRLRMSTYALCVEFAHDLQREPRDELLIPLRRLPKAVVDEARGLASHIRERHDTEYGRDADEVEARLAEEVRDATAEDLGKIDTLRFEDRKVFEAALGALEDDRFGVAADFARERTEERSFWVRHDRARKTAWLLVRLAADLGLACERHAELLRGAKGLDECAERYAKDGYEVDLAQRRLEQARGQLTLMRLDELPDLLRALNHVREVYRRYVDDVALAFQAICRQHGFLPDAPLRQRELFDDVVRPLAESGGPVAYFLVDALRFEMARDLVDQIGREDSTRLVIKPRYAELPTLTEVGMNALAPVSTGGRMQLELTDNGIRGFRHGQARVGSPETRRKAMHERVGGETCPRIPLEELLDLDLTGIKRKIARARLIVIHAEGLDKAGEKGVGLHHFEDELQRLRAAWGRLRDAGVQRFVMTADHGFLIQDDTTRRPVKHGRKTDAKRRHVIERVAADHDGEVRVSSSELGYDGDEVHFMFPATTAPFDTGERTKEFLHGGNSLQERLIPVITAEYRSVRGSGAERYKVVASADSEVMGLHRIRGSVTQVAQAALAFGGKAEVELRMRAIDSRDVAVELVHATSARIEAGAIVAVVGSEFEVLFRLTGTHDLRTKIELCAATGADEVESAILERRFTVDVIGKIAPDPVEAPAAAVKEAPDDEQPEWLDDFEEEGVRQVFAHIAKFGAINEADATRLLLGPRKFRRFSQRFDEYAEKVPFAMRIDVSSGQKRYVKEGGSAC